MECVSRCQCQKNKILDRKLSVIPSRYRDAHFGNYKPIDDVEGKALEKLSSDTFGSFFLYGDYGRGKTHLLIAQYRRVAKLDRPAMLFTMAELLCELRRVEFARFGTMADSEYVSLVIDRVKYSERFHLFLDDIDKFKVTEFKFEVLFDLLDTIWKRKLQLTVTSNYSLTDLIEQERLHPAIVRRIDDICQAVEV
jgi:DNA replication protein DnaC